MGLEASYQKNWCTFCDEFAGLDSCNFRKLFSREEIFSRAIRRSEHFVAFPGLGPLGDAYIIFAPIAHYSSMALLPPDLYLEFEALKTEVEQDMAKAYSFPIQFEHSGSFAPSRSAGTSVDHAHLHLVSTSVDLLDDLKKDATTGKFGYHPTLLPRPVERIIELREWIEQGVPYLFYANQEGEAWAFPVNKKIESQYLRRRLARKLGLADPAWDWRLFPRKTRVLEIWRQFYNIRKS